MKKLSSHHAAPPRAPAAKPAPAAKSTSKAEWVPPSHGRGLPTGDRRDRKGKR
jgi:hypothetical protein